MSATQMYPSFWGGFPWFNEYEDRPGATTAAAAALCSTSLVVG